MTAIRYLIFFLTVLSISLVTSNCSNLNSVTPPPQEKTVLLKVAAVTGLGTIDSLILIVKNETMNYKPDSIVKTTIEDINLKFLIGSQYSFDLKIIDSLGNIFRATKLILITSSLKEISLKLIQETTILPIVIEISTEDWYVSGDTIAFYDFETPLDSSWSTNFERDSSFKFDGKYSLFSCPNGVKVNSHYVAELEVNLSKSLNPYLSFWIRSLIGERTNNAYRDVVYVYASVDGGISWKNLYTSSTRNMDFNKVTLSLKEQSKQKIKLKFQYSTIDNFNVLQGGGIWIDQLMVYEYDH